MRKCRQWGVESRARGRARSRYTANVGGVAGNCSKSITRLLQFAVSKASEALILLARKGKYVADSFDLGDAGVGCEVEW